MLYECCLNENGMENEGERHLIEMDPGQKGGQKELRSQGHGQVHKGYSTLLLA
jgi:hypothetical protein